MEVSSTGRPASPPPAKTPKLERKQLQEQERKAEQKTAPPPPRSEEPKPRPVVNTQGQTTGRIVNATA